MRVTSILLSGKKKPFPSTWLLPLNMKLKPEDSLLGIKAESTGNHTHIQRRRISSETDICIWYIIPASLKKSRLRQWLISGISLSSNYISNLHGETTTSQQVCNRQNLPNMIHWRGNTPVSNTIQRSPWGKRKQRDRFQILYIIHLLARMRLDRLWVHLLSTLRHSHSYQSLLVTRNTPPSTISVWWVTQQRSKLTWT